MTQKKEMHYELIIPRQVILLYSNFQNNDMPILYICASVTYKYILYFTFDPVHA